MFQERNMGMQGTLVLQQGMAVLPLLRVTRGSRRVNEAHGPGYHHRATHQLDA